MFGFLANMTFIAGAEWARSWSMIILALTSMLAVGLWGAAKVIRATKGLK